MVLAKGLQLLYTHNNKNLLPPLLELLMLLGYRSRLLPLPGRPRRPF